MVKAAKKRISVSIESQHVGYIRSCLRALDHEDFTVSPIISGWGVRGYWSSERAFEQIGQRVMIRFTTDLEPIKPLLASGFGIFASQVLQIEVIDALN